MGAPHGPVFEYDDTESTGGSSGARNTTLQLTPIGIRKRLSADVVPVVDRGSVLWRGAFHKTAPLAHGSSPRTGVWIRRHRECRRVIGRTQHYFTFLLGRASKATERRSAEPSGRAKHEILWTVPRDHSHVTSALPITRHYTTPLHTPHRGQR